jgi:hypothetical protein
MALVELCRTLRKMREWTLKGRSLTMKHASMTVIREAFTMMRARMAMKRSLNGRHLRNADYWWSWPRLAP